MFALLSVESKRSGIENGRKVQVRESNPDRYRSRKNSESATVSVIESSNSTMLSSSLPSTKIRLQFSGLNSQTWRSHQMNSSKKVLKEGRNTALDESGR